MPVDLTKINASVDRMTTVKASVIAFISSVPQLIRDAITADDLTDATNVNALADRLEADATDIMNHIVANTPAESEPTPPPVEPPVEG